MADQAPRPLVPFDELFRPMEPPPADLGRPVCERTHKALLHRLVVLECNLLHLRKCLEMMPRHDAFVDGLRSNFAQALDEAGQAFALFMETRDCEGEA